MDFAPFDRRHDPTWSVREGYREWAKIYEDVALDEMDLRLLARVESVEWAWLAAVQPEVIVLLGATAAQALLGASFRVTRERGNWVRSNLAPHVMATVHPSSLLRIEDDAERKDAIREFVRELRKVAEVIKPQD